MVPLATLIAKRLDGWGELPAIVREVFDDPSPVGIARALEGFCRRELGEPVEHAEFFEASIGSVHGMRLRDGRRIVVKLHGDRLGAPFLEAMQAVQRHLARAGFPAPQPLVAPTLLGRGIAVAESLIDSGHHADAHDPQVRQVMARGLARLVALSRPLTGLDELRDNVMVPAAGRLWPRPHDRRFDFEGTSTGAEWIDGVAGEAIRLRGRRGRDVIGHGDWRAEHVRVHHGHLTAVYDWDSLTLAEEPIVVGSAAHAFTANWTEARARQLPTLEEALGFISDYEHARDAPFDSDERRVARASLAYSMAYTARCEHSDTRTGMGRGHPPPSAPPAGPPPGSARAFLKAHAAALLQASSGK